MPHRLCKHTLLGLYCASFLGACSPAPEPEQSADAETEAATAGQTKASKNAKAGPVIPPWGYPLDAFDHQTRPGDDFYRYANGGWLDATEIPSDRAGAGFSYTMRERNEQRIETIISDLANAKVASGTDPQRIRDLYASFMAVEQINQQGLKPLKAGLDAITAAKTHEDIAVLMANAAMSLPGPFGMGVRADAKDPSTHITYASHAGLGLPDKSYYERDSERLVEVREKYQAHIAAMLGELGASDTTQKAAAIFALENAIAELHWSRAERRDANKTYNRMDVAELIDMAPGFPWTAYMQAVGLADAEQVVVREVSAFAPLAELFTNTPVALWQDYLRFHYLNDHSQYLHDAIASKGFAFNGTVLFGQAEQRPRAKRGIELVNRQLDQAVGKIYIERFFPAESKALMTDLFENIRAAMRTRIQNLSWMTEQTKVAALEKLDKIEPKIAYPEVWYDYSAVRIQPTDLLGNIRRLREDAAAQNVAKLGQPVDKREWFTGPQTVNAFYSPTRNEAFVPAGYIQSPLFDPKADPALNYGAIGSIIGHEIGHGFDDQGSKYDGDGVLRNWWTDADREAFDALGDRLAAQFDQYEPLPGLNVNGRQTLGENIGDLAGVVVAYHAYLLSLDGKEAPVLNGFTGPQRVFLGRAQGRRFKSTEASLRRRLLSAPHSPMPLRVNGMVRNIDEWYEAFDVQTDNALYIAPDDRVRIW